MMMRFVTSLVAVCGLVACAPHPEPNTPHGEAPTGGDIMIPPEEVLRYTLEENEHFAPLVGVLTPFREYGDFCRAQPIRDFFPEDTARQWHAFAGTRIRDIEFKYESLDIGDDTILIGNPNLMVNNDVGGYWVAPFVGDARIECGGVAVQHPLVLQWEMSLTDMPKDLTIVGLAELAAARVDEAGLVSLTEADLSFSCQRTCDAPTGDNCTDCPIPPLLEEL